MTAASPAFCPSGDLSPRKTCFGKGFYGCTNDPKSGHEETMGW